jgi:hypothetical protein
VSFKTCNKCGAEWADREAFLADPDLRLIGYQVDFADLKAGLFMFNHSCRTTLAFRAEVFADLYSGPIFGERRTGGPDCLGYCLHREELRPCPAKCECAFVREILNVVKNHPKRRLEPTGG